jgi:hypothetical protein
MRFVLTMVPIAALSTLVGCGGKDGETSDPNVDQVAEAEPEKPAEVEPEKPAEAEPEKAAESIGSARMKEDGTLVLMLRAEGSGGIKGDALIAYKPDDPKYKETLDHLGGLKPGEEKPVPPWPDEPAEPAIPTAAPIDSDTFSITADQAREAGLPAIGFKVSGLKGHGWTRFAPDRKRYISLSGPPGGPLSFSVTPYTDGAGDPLTLEQLFRERIEGRGGIDPFVTGEPEKVELAGAEREAQAFRTGKSLATSNWCVVKVPSAEIEGAGLLVILRIGSKEDRLPTCKLSLKAAALAPLAKSFALE